MARQAIDGRVALLMAIQAIAHIQVHDTLRGGLFGHIAVARGALHARTNVRSVIEPDVRRSAIVVNPLPRDVFTAREVGGNFLDLRLILGNDAVAHHAETDVGDAGNRPLVNSAVTRLALQTVCEMHLMRKSNRLYRLRPPAQEVQESVNRRTMGGGKNA